MNRKLSNPDEIFGRKGSLKMLEFTKLFMNVFTKLFVNVFTVSGG
jgi:hypothetical protein